MKKRYILLLLSFIALSCNETVVLDDKHVKENEENLFVSTEGQTILGDTIEIPYTVENLLKAWENLPQTTKAQIDTKQIIPTHFYIRFFPKNDQELDILKNIKPYVFLSEIPLDRKIKVGGSSYHDPEIPEGLPTYQYTVVSTRVWDIIKSQIDIESQILLEAYMPDEDDSMTKSSHHVMDDALFEELLKEAYRITGNEYDIIPETKSSEWHPTGYIRAYDNLEGFIPVPGVRVRGQHLLKVHETLTDENGYFRLASFKNPASLRIIWESDEWDIRDGLVGQATFDGPTVDNTSWNCTISSQHEKNVRYAAIQRAAYRYWHGNIDGMVRPSYSSKFKFCQHDSNHGTVQGKFANDNGMGYHIEIWTKDQDDSYYDVNKIYSTASHEIAHAAHYSYSPSNYDAYSTYIKDSWALFAGGILSSLEYGTVSDKYSISGCSWPDINKTNYTPIFIDLYDNINQYIAGYPYPNDTISGYSCSSLNQILLNNSYTLTSLNTNVKQNKPQGISDADIDALFSYYSPYWID